MNVITTNDLVKKNIPNYRCSICSEGITKTQYNKVGICKKCKSKRKLQRIISTPLSKVPKHCLTTKDLYLSKKISKKITNKKVKK